MKYFGTVLYTDGRSNKRVVKVRCVKGSLARIIRGKNVFMEVKRGLKNSILLPTLTYGSDI